MEAIACVLLMAILWGITFLYQDNKERATRKGRPGAELAYLYTYRDILARVAHIESSLVNVNSHAYFTRIEIAFFKQQTQAKLRTILADFNQGTVDGAIALDDLDKISSRIAVVFFTVAA